MTSTAAIMKVLMTLLASQVRKLQIRRAEQRIASKSRTRREKEQN